MRLESAFTQTFSGSLLGCFGIRDVYRPLHVGTKLTRHRIFEGKINGFWDVKIRSHETSRRN